MQAYQIAKETELEQVVRLWSDSLINVTADLRDVRDGFQTLEGLKVSATTLRKLADYMDSF